VALGLHDVVPMNVLRPLLEALAEHAYAVVFFGALIDATGVPFPGRLLLAGAGAWAAAGHGSLSAFIALATLGAMASDQLWFWAANRGRAWLASMYCRLTRRAPAGVDEDIARVARYEALAVVLGRFFTIVRLVAWPVLARNGLRWPRFVAFDALGAAVWSSIWLGLGWVVGDQWQDAVQSVSGWLLLAGAIVVVGMAGPLALRVWRHRAQRSARGLSVPTETPVVVSGESRQGPRARPRP
jgi:membrane protein DedA with SNARE-associated domain